MSARLPDGFRWSYSKLTTFERCPQCFLLQYLERRPRRDNAFAEFGTLCHSLLERWATGKLASFDLSAQYAAEYDQAVEHPFPPFPAGMGAKYYETGLAYFDGFAGFGSEYDVLEAEERFEITIRGHPFVGIADLILRHNETDALMLMDHKTTAHRSMLKRLPTQIRQLYLYALYVQHKYGRFPDLLRFNMLRDDAFIDEPFDTSTYNETVLWIDNMIRAAETEQRWEARPSEYFCRYLCGVVDDCPAMN